MFPMLMDKAELPLVAVSSMNKTHAKEVDLINHLYGLITKNLAGEAVPELEETIELFRANVEQHFSSEEKLMEQTGFPAFAIHKNEHDRVRVALFSIIDVWKTTKIIQPLANYLENTHPNWAKNHIATMDTMTAFFIAQSDKIEQSPIDVS